MLLGRTFMWTAPLEILSILVISNILFSKSIVFSTRGLTSVIVAKELYLRLIFYPAGEF
jgi:hypothetical protein